MNKSQIREQGETASLIIGLLVLIVVSLIIFDLNFWVAIFLIVAQLIYILMSKRQMYGNSLLVTKDQFSDIDELVSEISSFLNIEKPKVFIEQDPYLNAYAFGFKKPYLIVLSSSLVEGLNRKELAFVIAHEIGHIYFKHTRTISLISPLGNNNYFLSLIYGTWQRKSEYTADKLAFMVTRNIKYSIKALVKLTVGPKLESDVKYNSLYDQIIQGEKQKAADVGELLLTHPYLLNRIEHLMLFNNMLTNIESKDE